VVPPRQRAPLPSSEDTAMNIRFLLAAALAAGAGHANAEIVARDIEYKIGETAFRSVLVYDDSVKTKRPGLVMFPNWYGMNDGQVEKARRIAGKDYVILVADVYGADTRPDNDKDAGAAAGAMYKDRSVLRTRANAALEALLREGGDALDNGRVGAIGFCFGGATALELARSGAAIDGVVSFHGNLSSDDPALAKNIKGSVLALNGADDTYVPAEQIQAFGKEMRDAGVDWQFVNLGGAVHCFAEHDARSPPGCVYNERAARRGFALMRSFFDETLR
jgi:dienelactone hydrolase